MPPGVAPPKVATSIAHWAEMMGEQLSIAGPKGGERIFAAQPANSCFSSGSSLSEKEYLLFRVIWDHQEDINKFNHYMRDNLTLQKTDGIPALYKGYVCRENDELGTQIYHKLESSFQRYLDDISSNKDGTRPGEKCGRYFSVRYHQGMVMSRVKRHTVEQGEELPSNIWKRGDPVDSSDDAYSNSDSAADAITASMASTSISVAPRTPEKQGLRPQPQMETPAVPRSYPGVGGKQNPATTDESYVNTAILGLLQMLTLSMAELGKFSGGQLDFGDLDWMADRLSLKLYRRQSGLEPAALMEARLDGFLCKRDTGPDGLPLFNDLPLAIVEAKACVRSAAGSAIRWQESAEMACWVSSLAQDSEHYGLLQSSTSGRKRRLLLSQNRNEIYIIIAEYGEAWKQYIRTGSSKAQPTTRTRDDARNLAGSDAFIWNSEFANPEEFDRMVRGAAEHLPHAEARQVQTKKLLDHDHFCFMHQWGPFRIGDHQEMGLLLRRLITLQVQLLSSASRPI